ncbi:hypothetical protein DPMN_116467 [Dreissena polymorpha]|uniref:Uncharacterized protein n=1 Tax=Dreissena polymorpha TaxID=45954 RepID=A0A9D4KNM2_DREPO|nr:hypothetical protein DPMN_116467 [Dreissena polymorpha]
MSALEETQRKQNEDQLEEPTINVNRHVVDAIDRGRRVMGERVVDLGNKYREMLRKFFVATESGLKKLIE